MDHHKCYLGKRLKLFGDGPPQVLLGNFSKLPNPQPKFKLFGGWTTTSVTCMGKRLNSQTRSPNSNCLGIDHHKSFYLGICLNSQTRSPNSNCLGIDHHKSLYLGICLNSQTRSPNSKTTTSTLVEMWKVYSKAKRNCRKTFSTGDWDFEDSEKKQASQTATKQQ